MWRIQLHPTIALLFIFSIAIWWRSLIATFSLALNNDEYTHILLIIPISAVLLFFEWKTSKPSTTPSPGIGSSLLIVAVLIGSFARWMSPNLPPDVHLSLNMFALVTWWIGSFVFCFGTRVSGIFLFPLCFLFWLVPFPTFLLDWAVVTLQHESADMTRMLFSAVGIPVTQNGMFISIPGVTVEVARECSSIRSSLMLLVTTMVLAQLFLHAIWRKTVVVLASIPLSVVKNAIRIFTLSVLGVHVDPGFLHGSLHKKGGIVFFILALLIVMLLLWLLGRGENKKSHNAIVILGKP